MDRCGRPSAAGLVALVAGLAAISLLATQASADACATVDCGLDAYCSAADDGSTECLCGVIGYAFNEATKTCIDPCPSVQCPEKAECVARGGKGECECELGYIMQNGACTDGLLQTGVEVEGLNYLSLLTFESPVPMAQATGATACTNVSDPGGSNTRITVEWTSIGVYTVGNGMCKSVSFHADPVCADKPGLTIARPGLTKVGGFFPVTTRTVKAAPPQSVSCEITTCHKDCGSAECVVKGGVSQCKCPWSFVFDDALKRCTNKSPSSTDTDASEGADLCESVKCARNSQCVVRNGQPMCECHAGYTKVNKGLCTAICKPDCPANGQCMVVGGKPVCRCKAGFRQDKSTCTPVCKPACRANAQCMAVKGKPMCQCNTGFKSVNNKCTPVCKPSCGADSQCVAVRGKPMCQCNTGFKPVNNKCTPVCKPACGANSQCMAVRGKPMCQCSSGFQLVNSKCTPK
ncbi:unnamed protein product [Closterium sp. NIES-65]|nr:unnamed protein product [Closterium sp. NIES-65]